INHSQLKELPLILPSQRHGLRLLLEQKIHQLKVAYEIDGLHLLMESISQLQTVTKNIRQGYLPANAALATGAVHHHLIKTGLRTDANI
ncbi:hypothetical protein O5706_28895, partial [Escherichia coli]|nr:hypothetical protein [Escherichia coli]